MKSLEFLRDTLLPDLAALIWPTECIRCERPDRDLCISCRDYLRETRSAHPVPGNVLAREPWVVAGEYDGVLGDLIVALKHEGRDVFAPIMGELLATVLKNIIETSELSDELLTPFSKPPLIVGVPSRPKKARERGFDHLQLVTGRALKELGMPKNLYRNVLQTLPGRSGQVGLSGRERIANARLIRVREKHRDLLSRRRVIVVDDVITTGASVFGAVSTLRSHGARVIGVAALARAVMKAEKIK